MVARHFSEVSDRIRLMTAGRHLETPDGVPPFGESLRQSPWDGPKGGAGGSTPVQVKCENSLVPT